MLCSSLAFVVWQAILANFEYKVHTSRWRFSFQSTIASVASLVLKNEICVSKFVETRVKTPFQVPSKFVTYVAAIVNLLSLGF